MLTVEEIIPRSTKDGKLFWWAKVLKACFYLSSVDRAVAQFRGIEQSSMSKGIKSHATIAKDDVRGNLKKIQFILNC